MAGKARTRPYNIGNAGAVSVAECELTFDSADARVVLVENPPADMLILDAGIEVITAFDSGTSDTGSIGTGAAGGANDGDILDSIDLQGAAGMYPATLVRMSRFAPAGETIYAYADTEGTAPAAGEARAFIVFARLADNGE